MKIPAVLDVHPLRTQLLLIGREAGTTRLVITMANGKQLSWSVTVHKFDPAKLAAEIKTLLGFDGVFVDASGLCPEVDCEACTQAQQEQIDGVMALYPCVLAIQHLTPPASVAAMFAGARRILGEGEDDTPAMVLDVRKGKVIVTGDALNDRDLDRLGQLRREFPAVRIRVRLPPPRSP